MIIKINKICIEKDGKTIINLPAENIYSSMEKLSNHLEFIKKLVSMTYKPDFIVSREEYEYLVYYSFLYFLISWDHLFYSKQTPWSAWINFKKNINELLSEERSRAVLDYQWGDLQVFREYISRNFSGVNLSTINLNSAQHWFLEDITGILLMNYFILRSIIKKLLCTNKKPKEEFDMIFLTNYDRYYGNNRFFGEHLFNCEEFINLIKNLYGIEIKKNNRLDKGILYLKPNFRGIIKYLKHLRNKSNDHLFIEDILYLRSGIKILLHYILHKKNYKINLNKNLNDDERFIIEMYNDFLLNRLPFVLWFYLSIKDFIKNKKIKLIIGDSERSFMFLFFDVARRFMENKTPKTIAFSHEIITNDYLHILVSKNFSDIPDYKLVWDEKRKEILASTYNWPDDKLIVFPDPRFLYWKTFPLKKKTILFISDALKDFYDELFSTFKNKRGIIDKIISKGYVFYFKPHPGEIDTWALDNQKKLKEMSEIKVIYELDFIPEYSIGTFSTLLYELLAASGKTYFLTDQNVFLIDEKTFGEYSKNSISDALLDILNK